MPPLMQRLVWIRARAKAVLIPEPDRCGKILQSLWKWIGGAQKKRHSLGTKAVRKLNP